MFIVEFCKDIDGECYKVLVFDQEELLRLINYIKEFEYKLLSVNREYMLVGYEMFKNFIKEVEKNGS